MRLEDRCKIASIAAAGTTAAFVLHNAFSYRRRVTSVSGVFYHAISGLPET